MAREYSARKRILVTGGAGFLGSHLCDALLARGYDVLCVDNLFTGTKDNVAHLAGHPQFEFMRHDVTWPLYVEVDEIYNLAAQSHVKISFETPEYTANADGLGVLRMLDDPNVYCVDVMKQLSAVQGAITKVNDKVLRSHIKDHVATAILRGDTDHIVDELMEALKYKG